MNIPRVVPSNNSEVTAMTMMLYSLPDMTNSSEAFAVMTGLGEWWRVADAIEFWKHTAFCPPQHLLIAGSNSGEKTFTAFDADTLKKPPYYLEHLNGVHIMQPLKDTKDQAEKIVEKVRDLNIRSLALFVSPFHLLRAYRTVLKAFDRLQVAKIPIFPAMVKVSPNTLIPEVGVNAWDMVEGEFLRLKKYQEQGDVATYQELKEYIDWLWLYHLGGDRKIG